VDSCGGTAQSNVVNYFLCGGGQSCGSPGSSSLSWTSELSVPGGRGQIVINGMNAIYPSEGRSAILLKAQRGTNRIEAQVVDASAPGTWRFELSGRDISGLRVIAGTVDTVTANAVTFRLDGRKGERVVFTFESN